MSYAYIINSGYVLYIFVSVFATTAANSQESSYACYCGGMRQTCLGDVYSVNWMEDSDQVCCIFPNFIGNSVRRPSNCSFFKKTMHHFK